MRLTPACDSEHGNQVCVCHAPVAAVSGQVPEVHSGVVPGCVSVPEIEDECQAPVCQFEAGKVMLPGLVEDPGARRSLQCQAQVALSGLASGCVPQSRASGAGGCPSRSGERAEDMWQLQQSFTSGCTVPSAFECERSLQVRQCHAPGPVVSGPFRGESAGLDPGCVPVSEGEECQGPFCQRKAGKVLSG